MTVNIARKKNLARCHVIQKCKGFARGEFKIFTIQGIQGFISLIFNIVKHRLSNFEEDLYFKKDLRSSSVSLI